jgi:class 3 adenylate cyclase
LVEHNSAAGNLGALWTETGAESIFGLIAEFLTGDIPDVAVDRVLATVLFTDIVGSTERASELGDRRWRQLLDAHDGLVRDQLHRFRGREINTTGDGFFASFDGPARAIRCAKAIVASMVSLGVELRAGLHTGECEVREDDLSGLTVHIGARVGSLAGPGEVLVSGTVRDLVVGSGIEFTDRGEQVLKGVPGAWKLFAVTG